MAIEARKFVYRALAKLALISSKPQTHWALRIEPRRSRTPEWDEVSCSHVSRIMTMRRARR